MIEVNMEDYKHYIRKVYKRSGFDFEDFYQECALNIYSNIHKYDETKGTVQCFVMNWIIYSLYNNSYRNERQRRAWMLENKPDDVMHRIDYYDKNGNCRADYMQDKSMLGQNGFSLTRRLLNNDYNLPTDLHDIAVKRYILDWGLKEIGDKYGITHQAIQQKIKTINYLIKNSKKM